MYVELDLSMPSPYNNDIIKRYLGGISMNQITLRQIPENVDALIRQLSKEQKKSINKTIIELLEKALGVSRDSSKKRNLSQLAGTWSDRESEEFKKNTAQFDKKNCSHLTPISTISRELFK